MKRCGLAIKQQIDPINSLTLIGQQLASGESGVLMCVCESEGGRESVCVVCLIIFIKELPCNTNMHAQTTENRK